MKTGDWRRWLRFSLRTFILVTALLVLGISHWNSSLELDATRQALMQLRSETASDLVVTDATKLHVKQMSYYRAPLWSWRIYVPPGRRYYLRLEVNDLAPTAPGEPTQETLGLEWNRATLAMNLETITPAPAALYPDDYPLKHPRNSPWEKARRSWNETFGEATLSSGEWISDCEVQEEFLGKPSDGWWTTFAVRQSVETYLAPLGNDYDISIARAPWVHPDWQRRSEVLGANGIEAFDVTEKVPLIKLRSVAVEVGAALSDSEPKLILRLVPAK